jgi:acetyl-CoA acyltransferase
MNAYIVAGYRTAVGKAKRGGFRFTRPDDLAVEVINHLTASIPSLDPVRVDDLIVGNAVQEAEQGMQMGRIISLMSLPQEVPGMIINRYCGSGLEAINIASARVHAGMADCIIAGGTESMSMVPVMGYKTALNYEVAKNHPTYYTSMGQTAEEVAKDYDVSREDMDEFSYSTQMKALNAL